MVGHVTLLDYIKFCGQLIFSHDFILKTRAVSQRWKSHYLTSFMNRTSIKPEAPVQCPSNVAWAWPSYFTFSIMRKWKSWGKEEGSTWTLRSQLTICHSKRITPCSPHSWDSMSVKQLNISHVASQTSISWRHTWGLVLSEVDVGQNEVDNGRAIVLHVGILGFKNIALLQSFPIKHVRVNLWEGELVHSSPLLCE